MYRGCPPPPQLEPCHLLPICSGAGVREEMLFGVEHQVISARRGPTASLSWLLPVGSAACVLCMGFSEGVQ